MKHTPQLQHKPLAYLPFPHTMFVFFRQISSAGCVRCVEISARDFHFSTTRPFATLVLPFLSGILNVLEEQKWHYQLPSHASNYSDTQPLTFKVFSVGTRVSRRFPILHPGMWCAVLRVSSSMCCHDLCLVVLQLPHRQLVLFYANVNHWGDHGDIKVFVCYVQCRKIQIPGRF